MDQLEYMAKVLNMVQDSLKGDKMNYTKGEWENIGQTDIAYSGFQIGAGAKSIAIVDMYPDNKIGNEGPANARLIAAAPSMYEFIKREYAKGRISKKEADVILAKAEGK